MADELNNTAQEVQDAVNAALQEQKKKKKKKRLIIVAIVLVFVIGIIALGNSGSSGGSENIGDNSSANTKTVTEDKKEEEADYEVGEGFAEVWTNSINTKRIRVAVPVKNTGSVNLYLSSCSIDVENKDGEIIDTIDYVNVYPQIIKPGETAYYYEETRYDGKDTKDIKVVPNVDVEKATVDCIRYSISEDKVKTEKYGRTSLLGRVENTTDVDGSNVYVTVNYFDKDGKFLSQQFTILDNDLKAGAKKGFETSPLNAYEFKPGDVGSYEVYAYPHQYQF